MDPGRGCCRVGRDSTVGQHGETRMVDRYGSFDAKIWMDDGVLHAKHPDCLSASARHLYLRNKVSPHATFMASAGRLVCSYTWSLWLSRTGSPSSPHSYRTISRVLVAVDSQSLRQAQEAGLLATDEDFEDQLWATFLTMARHGCIVVFQFFYSHVAFPTRGGGTQNCCGAEPWQHNVSANQCARALSFAESKAAWMREAAFFTLF